jgi:type I phosphodiesterase/nucleotide pyrophosphatase
MGGILAALLFTALSPAAPPGRQGPVLTVLVAVDQLRADLLDRYDSLFKGGFRRLRDFGFRFTEAVVDHGLTNSLPGHVTLASGAHPSRHGIVNSGWAEKVDGKLTGVFGVSDDASPIVGFPKLPGASPKRVLVDGIADWFLAADGQARAAAIGTGEYSSLLHAGRTRGTVYWFSPDAGRYVTSTWYRSSDPDWIAAFQKTAIPRLFANRVWKRAFPRSGSPVEPGDLEPAEFDGVHTSFPHEFAQEREKEIKEDRRAQAEWLYFTPMPDETTLRLAQEAVRQEKLGQRPGHRDYLAIVVSAVDHVGHRFGPGSLEQLDNLLRLDREIGEFLAFLDKAVGKGRYVLALSADHGCSDIPEAGRDPGSPGRRVGLSQIEAMMDRVLEETGRAPGTPDEIADRAARTARNFDFIGGAATAKELEDTGSKNDPILTLMSHSFRPDRVPLTLGSSRASLARFGVLAWLTEGAILEEAPANHGSPYPLDRRVPLIFFGAGVPKGASEAPARTVDLAPTLASLAGVPPTGAIDGHPLPIPPAAR